jgi:hypothetical protein
VAVHESGSNCSIDKVTGEQENRLLDFEKQAPFKFTSFIVKLQFAIAISIFELHDSNEISQKLFAKLHF